MKRLVILTAVMGLALGLAAGSAWGDDFFVVAGGGPSGKILKTKVLTSTTQNNTVGNAIWAKLPGPNWTYTKLSATSDLVITYQDVLALMATGRVITNCGWMTNPAWPGPTGRCWLAYQPRAGGATARRPP